MTWSQMKCAFLSPDVMVVTSSARWSVASVLSPSNVTRDVTPKILAGVFGLNTQQGTTYEWCLLALSFIINFILTTSLVVVVSPSDVSRFACVGTSGPMNIWFWLQIMAVAELSITKGVPSVSHEKESLMWSSTVENYMAYILGIVLYFARQLLTCHTNTFLSSLAKIEAKMGLYQCIIKPLATWYKYTNSITVSEIIYLIALSGGSGKIYKKKCMEFPNAMYHHRIQ